MRLKKLILAVAVVVALVVAVPVLFLANVWLRDPAQPLTPAAAGTDDASRLNQGAPAEVIAIEIGRAHV